MAVSTISRITIEGQPQGLSSFLRLGVPHVLWHSAVNGTGIQRLHWKPHSGANFTEVTSVLAAFFQNVTAIYTPATDSVLAIWDDGTAQDFISNGNLLSARFNALTGALMSGPTVLFPGSRPQLVYRGAAGNECLLYFVNRKLSGVYGCVSTNGGVFWQSAEPIITNQVVNTQRVKVIQYDPTHISLAQLGDDPKGLAEIGMFQRTRPLCSIVKHPTVANQFFVGEPSKFDNTTLIDNLRGSLVLATDNSKLFHLDGVQQGTSDSLGSVALLAVTGTALAVSTSAGPAGGANGDDLVSYSLVPALGALNVDLPGSSFAVSLGVSAAYGYTAGYSDSSTVGQLAVVDLSTGATGTVFSGVTGVRAVAVANFLSPPLIFVATTESGVERLRVYQENGLTPTLLLNTKLPARANSITTTVHPTNPTSARLLVSMVDRFSVFQYDSPSTPVLLVDHFQFPGGGQFFKSVVSSRGNVIIAAGNAGILVLSPTGKTKAQIQVSGKVVAEWVKGMIPVLNQLVRPRSQHQFARSRFYFKCTTPGTSSSGEPAWVGTGTVNDGGAQWQAVGLLDGVATDVALDEVASRIYAVGVVGGNLGTDGRVWVIEAGGLL